MKKFLVMVMTVLSLFGCGKDDQEKVIEKVVQQEQVEDINSTENVEKKIKFGLDYIDTNTENSTPSIELTFSKNIDTDDPSAYIKIEPAIEVKVLKLKNRIVLMGEFKPLTNYFVTVLKGLKGGGEELQENIENEVSFKELPPRVVFSSEGIILPKNNNSKISFKTVNVKKVNVVVNKVFPNNYTQFLQNFLFRGNGDVFSYSTKEDYDRVGEQVFKGEFKINNRKNIWLQNQLDISKFTKEKGIYLVYINFDKDDVDYDFSLDYDSWEIEDYLNNNGSIGKAVIISDMGIVMQATKDGKAVVTVNDVTKNLPISGAKVSGITYNNQIIEEKTTDEKGEVEFNNSDKIFYILAEKNEEFSILKPSNLLLSTDGFNVNGLENVEEARTYIYSDRGIYRPGDTVNIGVIARNKDGMFPQDQPLVYDVFTPNGDKYIDKKVVKNGKNGFFTFSFKTELTSNTGVWTVVVYPQGTKEKSIHLNIPIETIVPNKITVDTEFPKNISIDNLENLQGEIKSKYLFGNPASNLKFTSTITIREKYIEFKDYPNFVFNYKNSYISEFMIKDDGILDNKGVGKIEFKKDITNIPKNVTYEGRVETKVIQDDGRPVINKNAIEINKLKEYVGIKSPEENYLKTNSEVNTEVVVVSSENQKLVPGKKIKYKIYKRDYSWWWDYDSDSSIVKSIKNDNRTQLVGEGELLSTSKPSYINYTFGNEGQYLIEVENMETNQTSGVVYYVDSWNDATRNRDVSSLKIETDKKKYLIGDKAKVTFEGTKGARALITISKNGNIISRNWKKIEDIKTTLDVEITKDMFPNAYISVLLFQKYGETENDRDIRLYGVTPLMVEDESKKLNINIEAPDEIRPNEKFTLKISNKEKKPMDYTVSIVDEGLLDLTNFKTPNPYNYFYDKIAYGLKIYDNYSEIIGMTKGEVHQVLTPGGGFFMATAAKMEKNSNDLGFEQRKRFVPVAIFKGVLTTDENGEGKIDIDMPNYNGSVRVMVTAANNNNYGSAEKKIAVKAPVIADVGFPRALKIGDELTIPVNIFFTKENIGNAEVILNFLGKSYKETTSSLKIGKEKVTFKIKVGDIIGSEDFKLEVKTKDYIAKEEFPVDITSTYPYIYENEVKFIKDGVETFELPNNMVKNSFKGFVTVSSSPILSIDKRISEIIKYPHGCLEQTVSKSLPQLYLNQLTVNKLENKQQIIDNINAAIKKLYGQQLSTGGFSYWPGLDEASNWASIYATQFLTIAKDKGYYVPDSMYEKALRYLRMIVKDNSVNLNDKAFAIFVLTSAGIPEIGELNYLYDNNFDKLATISKWYVAGSYALLDEKKLAKEIVEKYLSNIGEYTLEDKSYYYYSYGSEIRDDAIILQNYFLIYGKPEEKLYNLIVGELQSENWLSTQTIGYSMMALGEMKVNKNKGSFKADIVIGGNRYKIASQNNSYQMKIPEGTKDIKVSGNNIYTNIYWEGIPVKYEMEDVSNNIVLSRNFYDENGKSISVKELPIGKSFYMVIGVKNTSKYDLENVALTQILPSGWEIENTRGLNLNSPDWIKKLTEYNYLNYEDIRDDRVNFFFYLDNGKKEQNFVIKINTVTAGKYNLPGTLVEGMYNINYKAYLKGYKVEVK